MDMFDFEDLIAEMLNVSDEQRDDDSFLEQAFYDKFDIEMELGFKLARKLLEYTPQVTAGLSGTQYHAFVSKKSPVMLMKIEAEKTT